MIIEYFIHLFVLIGIYAILAMSLNLAMGFTGLLNIGHIAFYGIGAYTSALLVLRLGMPFWFALLLACVVAALFGLLLSIPTVRLRGDYLALATLGFAIIFEAVTKNWISLTKGPLGLAGIPRPAFFGSTFSYMLLVFAFVVITYIFISHLTKTPFGRVLKAIREDEIVAKALGKDTTRFKVIALAISAFFAGLAGGLYAHYISFIDPGTFSIMESILIISMVIVGGLGSIEGSIIGAVVLTLLPEPLRFLPLPSYVIGASRQIIYALLLVMMLLVRPGGFLGKSVFKRES
jgi:branched-chain amino acid transport system permease protein